jgi:hypothetical protein
MGHDPPVLRLVSYDPGYGPDRRLFVKNVTRPSWPQACYLVPVHGQVGDIFYKRAHTEEVWLIHPKVLYREEGLHARVTSWRS